MVDSRFPGFEEIYDPNSHNEAYLHISMNNRISGFGTHWERIKNYCLDNNISLLGVFASESTSTFASDYLHQVIHNMKENSCDTLIVSSITQFGRNTTRAMADIKKLIDAGITVFSVQNGDLSDVCKDFFPLLAETDAESDIEDEPEDGFVLSM